MRSRDTNHMSYPWQPVVLLWLCISLALVYAAWPHIVDRSGWDPDDQLRLVQLRDFLGGQSWFDTTQYRMNPPHGAPMHWSRLIELPLAAIILLLKPFFGQAVAESVAGTIIPLAGLGLTAYFLGQLTAKMAGREAGLVASGIALLSPILLIQFRPMRIDHHGWQIVMASIALSATFWDDRKRGGLAIGIALAIWQHISMEGATIAAAFFILLGWRWIFEKAQGLRLLWSIISFAVGSLALLMLTQSRGMFAPTHCDTISPPHIAAIGFAAIVMVPAILARLSDRRLRFAAAAFAGIGAAIILLLLAPMCSKGAFGNLDPLVREYWYININEGLPVWHQDKEAIVGLMAAPFCGLFALFLIRGESKAKNRAQFGALAFFLIYGLVVSALVFRTVSIATIMAVPVTAILIVTLFQKYRKSQRPLHRVGLVAAMILLALPGGLAIRVMDMFSAQTAKAAPDANVVAGCEGVESVAALETIKGAHFLAPFDMGPTILMATHQRVLASSHHRNEMAMHDHIRIFISPPDEARKLLHKRGITHIAACMNEAELKSYAKRNPDGLWAMLASGQTPFYIAPPVVYGKGINVWHVRY